MTSKVSPFQVSGFGPSDLACCWPPVYFSQFSPCINPLKQFSPHLNCFIFCPVQFSSVQYQTYQQLSDANLILEERSYHIALTDLFSSRLNWTELHGQGQLSSSDQFTRMKWDNRCERGFSRKEARYNCRATTACHFYLFINSFSLFTQKFTARINWSIVWSKYRVLSSITLFDRANNDW